MEQFLAMQQFLAQHWWMVVVAALWVIPWKGVALWRAAQLKQKWWFIVLLIINTLAILEILYIFVFSKRQKIQTEI